MNTPKLPRHALALLSALALLTSSGQAQAVQQPSTDVTTKDKDDTVVLSPFTVTTDKDKGYKATNAISGTRLNAAIKDVPLSLEVITKDFMRDTGATSLRDSLRYSAGVVLDSQNDALVDMAQYDNALSGSASSNDPRGATRNKNQSTQKIRGFVVDQVMRDGFRRQSAADWINIERVEVVRGPSALLYGVGSFGGVINYVTKRPTATPQTHLAGTLGSYGFFRGEFDQSGPLNDQVGYRVTGAMQWNGDETDYYQNKQYFISPVFTYRPWKNTEILLDTEFGYQTENGIGFQTIRRGEGSSGVSSAAVQRGRMFNAVPGTDPRKFRYSGPDTYRKSPTSNIILDVTQKITDDLFVKAGLDYSHVSFDTRNINQTGYINQGVQDFPVTDPNSYYPTSTVTLGGKSYDLRSALTNPPTGFTAAQVVAAAGAKTYRGANLFGPVDSISTTDAFRQALGITTQPTHYDAAVLRYDWVNTHNEDKRWQSRVEANYRFEVLGTKHNFLLGLQTQDQIRNDTAYGPPGASSNYTGNANVAWSYKSPTDFSVFHYGVQGDGLPDPAQVLLTREHRENYDLGYYAVYQGKFLKDRVTLIGGYRWDRLDYTDKVTDYGKNTAADYSRSSFSSTPPSKYSPQAGVSVALTPGLSVFGLYSTGLIPNYNQPNGLGQTEMITAKNVEYGVKFDLFHGRLSGTISRYQIDRKNTPFYLWWAPAPFRAVSSPMDKSQPMATIFQWMGPEGIWYAIRNTPNGLNIAKQIFPKGYWATLDNLAKIGPSGTSGQSQYYPNNSDPLWNTNPSSNGQNTAPSNWWSITWTGKTPGGYVPTTDNATYGNGLELYFPLINLSDANVNAFAYNAFKWASSDLSGNTWPGQFYGYNNGTSLAYGNGTFGTQNIPGWNGAAVPINDRANGWDTQIIWTPTDDLQIMFNYAYVNRKITSQFYKYVNAYKATGYNFLYGMWNYPQYSWGTGNGASPDKAYSDPNDTSTSIVPIAMYGKSLDDTPKDQASVWAHYSFRKIESLKHFDAGLGAQYRGRSQWYSGFNTDGTTITATDPSGKTVPVVFWTNPQYTYNLMLAYNTRLSGRYNLRVALNVDNLLNDRKEYGLVYARGRSWRVTTSLDF